MPNTRHAVAEAIATKFLPAKRATTDAAIAGAAMIGTMLEERRRARLQPGVGSDVIKLGQEANNLLIEAQLRFDLMHELLAEHRRDLGVPAYAYGADDTPPNGPAKAHLHAVPTLENASTAA